MVILFVFLSRRYCTVFLQGSVEQFSITPKQLLADGQYFVCLILWILFCASGVVAHGLIDSLALEHLVGGELSYRMDNNAGDYGVCANVFVKTKTVVGQRNRSSISFLHIAPNGDCGVGVLYCTMECCHTSKIN